MIISKQEVFLKKIIFSYAPDFTDQLVQQHYLNLAVKYPKSVNVEHLTEIALATQGGYDFVDNLTHDFNDQDLSDSKTSSIVFTSTQVFLNGIENKIGALRICIYNPYKQDIDYMFMPYAQWQLKSKRCFGKNTEDKLRLIMKYTVEKDTYNQYEKYRLSSFTELAKMTSSEFYKRNPTLAAVESDPEITQ